MTPEPAPKPDRLTLIKKLAAKKNDYMTEQNIFPAPSGVDEPPPVATMPADHGITLWGVGAMDAAGGAPKLQWDIEIPCQKCAGTGEVECCECGHFKDCPECDGEGTLQDIGDFKIPEKHKAREEMERVIADHDKCHADHDRLCHLNPRAKESYDAQLTATAAKLTEQLKTLL